jgi:UDP-N-acetylglucosamine 2-epimerase (non-hydrolysing)
MAMPVSRALRARHEGTLVHTGQHYDDALSAVFFEELSLPEPDHELGVGSGRRSRQIARVEKRLGAVLDADSPDVVVVYGDTNSTLGAALAAAGREIPLVHVEAGVRSFDPSMPEERNRRRIDRLADHLCAPTRDAAWHLRAEGVDGSIHFTGDVRRDAYGIVTGAGATSLDLRDRFGVERGAYVLATVHRAATTDEASDLRSVFAGLAGCDRPAICPLHPRTEGRLREYGLLAWVDSQVDLVDPVGYPAFLGLVERAGCVATDSGGVQREAMLAETPCVTLRDRTEWRETVRHGCNRLAGTDTADVRRAVDAAVGESVRRPPVERDVTARILDVLDRAADGEPALTAGRRGDRCGF